MTIVEKIKEYIFTVLPVIVVCTGTVFYCFGYDRGQREASQACIKAIGKLGDALKYGVSTQ